MMKLLMMTLSLMFMYSVHPMFLTIITIMQSLMVCMTINLLSNTSWMAYTLFLIFLGGMMILFIYMCSLASNEGFKNKMLNINKKSITMVLITASTTPLISMMDLKIETNFYKMFNSPFMSVTAVVMMYLLFVLIIMVKNVGLHLGPLRMKKN